MKWTVWEEREKQYIEELRIGVGKLGYKLEKKLLPQFDLYGVEIGPKEEFYSIFSGYLKSPDNFYVIIHGTNDEKPYLEYPTLREISLEQVIEKIVSIEDRFEGWFKSNPLLLLSIFFKEIENCSSGNKEQIEEAKVRTLERFNHPPRSSALVREALDKYTEVFIQFRD